MSKFWLMLFVAVFGVALSSTDVDAKRLGGGASIGKQSPNVTHREAAPRETPAAPASAAPATQAQSAVPNAAGQAAPAAPRNRWLGPLAGIAAGVGLAALASHLGFGEGFGMIMLVMLVALVGLAIARRLMARRGPAVRAPYEQKFAYSGVGQEAAVPNYAPVPSLPREPEVVRPPRPLGLADAEANGSHWRIPAGFDADAFLGQAKAQYVRMQSAFDASDFAVLREFTTAEMYDRLKLDIDGRMGAGNHTDVVTLNAQLLGIESSSVDHMASVRFSGMVRESSTAAAEAFDEVWNLTKPLDGSSGWVLAGVQQFH
jgi:predicted lipid-binding transport protein (Tim44 family)